MKFDIKHEDRETFNLDREQADALGYPPAVIEAALKAARQAAASSECRRRIYAHANAGMQMNMAVTAGVIAAKTASARTEQEKAVLDAITAARDWVDAMRTAYRDMPAKADYRADER